MVKSTSQGLLKQGVMDQIGSKVENLKLSNARETAGDGSTFNYKRDTSIRQHNEDQHHRQNQNIPEDDLAARAQPAGVAPSPDEIEEDGNDTSDESSDEDSSSEDEEIKAPIELLGEFLQYIRTSDWDNAAKLCEMILIYEPDNAIALQFQTVIEEKSVIEKELAEMSSSSDEEDYSSEEDSSEEDTELEDQDSNDGDEQEPDDEFDSRPGSTMKNPLIFPYHDPVWKP